MMSYRVGYRLRDRDGAVRCCYGGRPFDSMQEAAAAAAADQRRSRMFDYCVVNLNTLDVNACMGAITPRDDVEVVRNNGGKP